MKTYKGFIRKLEPNQIFVFGSNTQGIHGAGAALCAYKHFGAVFGQSKGLMGQSYGIITKDLRKPINEQYRSVSKEKIIKQIGILYDYAKENNDKEFLIAYSGTGFNLNGYSNQEMVDMFSAFPIPDNIVFEEEFYKLLKNKNF